MSAVEQKIVKKVRDKLVTSYPRLQYKEETSDAGYTYA